MKRIAVPAIVLVFLLFLPEAGSATQGVLSCRASVVRIEGPVTIEPFVANEQFEPCVTDHSGVLSFQQSGIDVRVVSAQTEYIPGPREEARAEANVAKAFIDFAGHQIGARVLHAFAHACKTPGGMHGVRGHSTIAEVMVDGMTLANVNQHQDIPLGSATLHLNEKIETQDQMTGERTRTHRALWLDTPAADVIIAEAVADT